MFLRKRNRRRIDRAKLRAESVRELKAAARRHSSWVFSVLGSLAVSAGLGWGGVEAWRWARTSPRFALSAVGFHGQERATEAELTRLGNLTLGTNLFTMDTGAIERALVAHPWVKQATVHRRLPSRLSIDVVEHRALAMVALGDLYLVNDEGEPFKRAQAGEALDLPLLTGVDREALVSDRDDTLARLKAGLALATAYAASPASKGHPLSEVHLDVDGFTLVTTSGEELQVGAGDLEAKLERLARVRAELAHRSLRAEVIRLDNRARPGWITVQLTAGEREDAARAAIKQSTRRYEVPPSQPAPAEASEPARAVPPPAPAPAPYDPERSPARLGDDDEPGAHERHGPADISEPEARDLSGRHGERPGDIDPPTA